MKHVSILPALARVTSWVCCIALLALGAPRAEAQESVSPGESAIPVREHVENSGGLSVGLQVLPEIWIPVRGAQTSLAVGGGSGTSVVLGIGERVVLAPLAELGYDYVPLRDESGKESTPPFSFLRAGAGIGLTFRFGERLSTFARVTGGYLGAILHSGTTQTAGTFYATGGGGLTLDLGPNLGVALQAAYGYHHDLFDGLTVSLGSTIRLSGRGGGLMPSAHTAPLGPAGGPVEGYIRFSDARLDTVFPVLYKHYDTHPVGSVILTNTGDTPLNDVEVRLALSNYIDAPKLSARIDSLPPGEQSIVDLYVLFNERVLEITEGAKVITEVTADYRLGERAGRDAETVTLDTYDRNALRWDDDRKIAAFVTTKDDEIQRWAKNVASLLGDQSQTSIDPNLRTAMIMFTALGAHGTSYVVDPSSAYEDLSQNPLAVDYVQFPRQTLQFKAGDCDDLSATFCALMEAAGVPAAFITVPGHIYTAVRLRMPAEDAARAFTNPDDIIVTEDDTAWLPVEVTLVGKSFQEAWAAGARQWREHAANGNAALYPVAEAWREYDPVAFAVTDFEIAPADARQVTSEYERQMSAFINQQIYGREQRYLQVLERRPADLRTRNALAVLYARYGLTLKAVSEFQTILSESDSYIPARINLGNLYYLSGDLRGALAEYQTVLRQDPDNALALLGSARINHELENYGTVADDYERLAAVDPELAERWSHLQLRGEEGARASSTAEWAFVVEWAETE